MIYNARALANMSEDEIWALDTLPETTHTVQFDDGELVVDVRSTIFSWYCQVFHRLYQQTPMLREHHLGATRLGARSHLDLLGRGLFAAFDYYRDPANIQQTLALAPDNLHQLPDGRTVLNMEVLTKQVYLSTNQIYNKFSYTLEEYVTGVSILDFIDVVLQPDIKRANDNVKPSQASIDSVYRTIESTLLDPKQLHGNPVAKAAKSGLVSMGQNKQCVGPRGFLSDINSEVFPIPVLTGYVHGIYTLADSMKESRSAAKALEFAKDPVAESEYFNRKMQLGCSTLQRVHYIDCGTLEGMEYEIHSTNFDAVTGKQYMTAEGWRPIREHHRRSLVGQTVLMRTVFKCLVNDRSGVCAECMGDLAWQIPEGTNLGHVSATVMCEEVSQNVLSTKHLDGSSTVDEMELTEYEQQYIQLGTNPNLLQLAPNLAGKRVLLTIPADSAPHLSDVNKTKNVRSLTLSRVSEIREVTFTVITDGVEDVVVLPVSMGSRLSSLTHEALIYIKRVNWSLTPQGDYLVDLADFNMEDPLFELPLKQINMVDFMKSIEAFLRSSKKTKQNRHLKVLKDFATPEEGLKAFHELVSSKLKVNIAWLENIILATMIVSAENGDHRLPGPHEAGEIGSYEDNMRLRSLAAAMAYQKQEATIFDIQSYSIRNRSDHPQDKILMGR